MTLWQFNPTAFVFTKQALFIISYLYDNLSYKPKTIALSMILYISRIKAVTGVTTLSYGMAAIYSRYFCCLKFIFYRHSFFNFLSL